MLWCRIHAEKMQRFAFMQGHLNGQLLTDPMPESATESRPESMVCVLLLCSESVFSALSPTGQLILVVILLVLVTCWVD